MCSSDLGTRTYHRLTCAIEDAGWEIRDCIMWMYGSGFPKSMDVSKAIDKVNGQKRIVIGVGKSGKILRANGENERPYQQGKQRIEFNRTIAASDLAKQFDGYGTALKPAYEPIIVAMKPIEGTFANNAEVWGQAGINIDGCRVGTKDNLDGGRYSKNKKGEDGSAYGKGINVRSKNDYHQPKGRWPANIILDEEAGAMLDQQSGFSKSSPAPRRNSSSDNVYGKYEPITVNASHLTDSGGASRFFYCAKASSKERNEGCKNNHPTVKSLALMEYLITLVSPPADALILDPFAGSGTTILAAKRLCISAIGIEKEPEYITIARNRLDNGELFT